MSDEVYEEEFRYRYYEIWAQEFIEKFADDHVEYMKLHN